ncbi:hypothetical protein V6N13_102558 [Hibiscus sabdariffa]
MAGFFFTRIPTRRSTPLPTPISSVFGRKRFSPPTPSPGRPSPTRQNLLKFVVVSSSFHRRSVLHVRRFNSFLSRFSSPPDCLFSRLISERGRFEELEKRERSFVKYEHR